MPDIEIHQFPCLNDNFGVLLHDPESKVTASIDAPDARAVTKALGDRGWTLTHILTTHHHHDHTGGIQSLKGATGCIVVGPQKEAGSIPGIDVELTGGDSYSIGAFAAEVIDTPGHTAGHITYWLPDAKVALVGDTLFSLGCGRLLEGTPEIMWHSLSKLAALPADTAVYCGHEYTLANAEFALTVEPENRALTARAAAVKALRDRGEPTLPTTIGQELATNPFLRPDSAAIQKRLNMEGRELWEIFGEIRRRKDKA